MAALLVMGLMSMEKACGSSRKIPSRRRALYKYVLSLLFYLEEISWR